MRRGRITRIVLGWTLVCFVVYKNNSLPICIHSFLGNYFFVITSSATVSRLHLPANLWESSYSSSSPCAIALAEIENHRRRKKAASQLPFINQVSRIELSLSLSLHSTLQTFPTFRSLAYTPFRRVAVLNLRQGCPTSASGIEHFVHGRTVIQSRSNLTAERHGLLE